MTLLLTGTREHALLAMLAQEAGSAAAESGGYLGRTAMQKIPYFLQILGVPVRYRFDLHHYGSYCDTITRDLEWLKADGVLEDRSNNAAKYSNYQPGPAIAELLARHAGELEPHRQTVKNVVRVLFPLSPERLELIATLHYLYRERRASGGNGPWKEAVVSRFLEVKKDKFPAGDVSASYEQLVAAGLLEQ